MMFTQNLEFPKPNDIQSAWTVKWTFECFHLIINCAHWDSNHIRIQMIKLSSSGTKIILLLLNTRLILKSMILNKGPNSSVQLALSNTARGISAVSEPVQNFESLLESRKANKNQNQIKVDILYSNVELDIIWFGHFFLQECAFWFLWLVFG